MVDPPPGVRPVDPELPFTVDTWGPSCGQPQFLTHAHKDHCQGIEVHARRVFCTDLTRQLVCNKYPELLTTRDVTWTTLDLNVPLHLTAAAGGIHFTVTALEADHCPGACMLLFSSDTFGTVLHTGDARLGPTHVSAVHTALEQQGDDPSALDLVYLDATFGEEAQDFPSREESLSQLSHFIATSHSPRIYVCAEGLGSEEVITHLCSRLGCAVHLPSPSTPAHTPGGFELLHAQFQTHKLHEERARELQILVKAGIIPAAALSSDPASRVHIIGGRRLKALGARCATEGVPVIKLSTQKWCLAGKEDGYKQRSNGGVTRQQGASGFKPKPTGPAIEDSCYFILYSMHSSRQELSTFLRALSPRAVEPHSGTLDECLMPSATHKQQVLDRLRANLRHASIKGSALADGVVGVRVCGSEGPQTTSAGCRGGCLDYPSPKRHKACAAASLSQASSSNEGTPALDDNGVGTYIHLQVPDGSDPNVIQTCLPDSGSLAVCGIAVPLHTSVSWFNVPQAGSHAWAAVHEAVCEGSQAALPGAGMPLSPVPFSPHTQLAHHAVRTGMPMRQFDAAVLSLSSPLQLQPEAGMWGAMTGQVSCMHASRRLAAEAIQHLGDLA